MDDYLKVDVQRSKRCDYPGCKNKPKDFTFYLTEWEMMTGASTDGMYYCEECVRRETGTKGE